MKESDYKSGHVPPEYKCSKCGKHKVKLWRQYQTIASAVDLLCFDCAHEDQADEILDIHKREMKGGFSLPSGDQIWGLVPAIPSETSFWGYT